MPGSSPQIASSTQNRWRELLEQCVSTCGQVVLGKQAQIKLAITCLLANGHLLIEDIPGVGKTTLAHALAKVLGLEYQRIQFTSDLLPADILGAAIFDKANSRFVFQPGPIFNQVILADEVNRTTPKSQSALLEAMEEQQVTIEGQTHPLPSPFFVIATQNPSHQTGTFPLPESQLDRFLMRLELGYPDRQAEQRLLAGQDRRALLAQIKPILSPKHLLSLQQTIQKVHAAEPIIEYLQRLLDASRESERFSQGLSPRAGIGLLQAARAWAFLTGRDFVIPEDIQSVLPSVIGHRLTASDDRYASVTDNAKRLIEAVSVP